MIIVSTRDFKANQTKFLDMARQGEDIILKSRSSGCFKLTPMINEPEENQNLTDELVAALRQMKDHLDGKIKLATLDEVINEL